MELHDSWFFIGIFVFIFLIWIATGGPVNPLAFSGPRLALPGELGGGSYLSLPRAAYTVGDSNTVSLPGSSSESTRSDTPEPSSFLGGTVSFGEVSPYRGIVSISHSISGAGSTDPRNESLMLSVTQNTTIPVNISGWRLISDISGTIVIIPKGTEVPTSGTINASQDIVLTAGNRAILISGQSPIGASFRENKCIGYFSTFQTFSPSLPQSCPTPESELLAFYGANYARDIACIDHVDSLPRCQTTLSPPAGLSSACRSFLVQYLNYNGCLDAHRGDADFKGNTWRIYLGRTSPLWRTRHEVVKLLDSSGKTVDAFSY